MPAFTYIGETLRRLRKELGKTLEEIGAEAQLGRGQLSRIENSRQEATLSTLAKILASQGISRKEFFRRYDLVEAEAFALRKGKEGGVEPGAVDLAVSAGRPGELQDIVRRFGSWIRALTEDSPSTAQGAIEVGDFVFTFKVMPKAQLSLPLAGAPDDSAPSPKPPPTKARAPRRQRKNKSPRS